MWLFAGLMFAFASIVIFLIILTHIYISKAEIESLDKRYVFITGCDTGFGNLLARTLDAKGVKVIAGCLTEKGSNDLKEVTSSRLKTVLIDVTDKKSIKAAYEFTLEHTGNEGLWGLVNNAGIMPTFAPVEWTPVEDFEGACKVNLFGTISVSLQFLPLLRQSQGRLVNVSSVTSTCAYPGIANYVISKAGVKMFSTCLRRELLNTGVTVHSIEPGGFKTNITEQDRLINILKKAYLRAEPETREFYGGQITTRIINGMKLSAKHVRGHPQTVADAMTHALVAKQPKLRYLVGTDAHLFFRLLSWLPEWIVDHIIGWPAPYGEVSRDFEELHDLKNK
ncbi:retinol dehydrogenase 7-like [Mercenaria mercenaria]|uniref:retinol dehydrogenase 7-like n=1 Tax=Mercenaria mercenaria TaxID=6596 RepID=UPI00234EA50F|nr:retinol dehydrogenase 7-like [Mercenaria mercenaria]